MHALRLALLVCGALQMGQALAWGNHSFPTYRALERLPELADAAPVEVEPLDAFLRSEENTIEVLLASQEAWAGAQLSPFPDRPAAIAFTTDLGRSDEARRQAFLMALRVAPNSKFALFLQTDPWAAPPAAAALPYQAVSTLVEPEPGASYHFQALRPGDLVSPLSVVASATDEPDFGLDQFLWEDSPSDWGKAYNMGKIPYGDAAQPASAQQPLHVGYMRESRLTYLGLPALRHNFLLFRNYQFATLSELALRTGHAYWGWRFAGMSLHYLQNLTQPFRASLAQGDSTLRLMAASTMATLGLRNMQLSYMALASNRLNAVELYESALIQPVAAGRRDSAIEKALHNLDKDHTYGDWTEHYLRDVVAPQSAALCQRLNKSLQAVLPVALMNDPTFDMPLHDNAATMSNVWVRQSVPEKGNLDATLAEILMNYGAHSRNAIRGILRASSPM